MDRAYYGAPTRALAMGLGCQPVVPPLSRRPHPWLDERELYRRCNLLERFLRRLKRLWRIAIRYDELDVVFLIFTHFAVNANRR